MVGLGGSESEGSICLLAQLIQARIEHGVIQLLQHVLAVGSRGALRHFGKLLEYRHSGHRELGIGCDRYQCFPHVLVPDAEPFSVGLPAPSNLKSVP